MVVVLQLPPSRRAAAATATAVAISTDAASTAALSTVTEVTGPVLSVALGVA